MPLRVRKVFAKYDAVAWGLAFGRLFHTRHDLTLSCPVAFQLVGDERSRLVWQAFEQFFEELLGGFPMTSALNQNVENMVVLIHGSPQIVALTLDTKELYIQLHVSRSTSRLLI